MGLTEQTTALAIEQARRPRLGGTVGMRLATACLLGTALSLAPVVLGEGTAAAQVGGHSSGGQTDGGHADGGHEDGGDDEGGHVEGDSGTGGKGKQKGKTRSQPVAAPVLPAGQGANPGRKAGQGRGLVEDGYLRLELGAARGSADNANWLPPGYPGDPQVFFDLDTDSTALGAVALGRSLGNGWRAEGALNLFGRADVSGPWSYTVPETSGPHADVAGSVRSVALLANGYYDIATGGTATPFVTLGVGLSHNTMGDWTRINPDSERTTRGFEGGSDTGFAWSVGLGVAQDVGPVIGSAPAKLEVAWRYFDLGSVTGGATPLPGSGSGGDPVQPLRFDVSNQVISVGLRIPF